MESATNLYLVGPKKKSNKKKKGGKGKTNGDGVKDQDHERDIITENGDGGDAEDQEKSGVVRENTCLKGPKICHGRH
jgi:hypothetical protein